MPAQDTSELKEKIISVIRQRGPSLPVHIAKETGLSILFASAFLSELLSEKKIKMSDMRIGSSPIYYLSGQEFKLEPFSIHLNSKEKEAFAILQNKKIIKDREQEPAIRVALRAIKDFAVPFRKNEEIFWRYYLTSEMPAIEERKKETEEEVKEEKQIPKELNIFEHKTKQKKTQKKKIIKTNDKFFDKVKEYLASKNTEILDILSFNKNELILKVKEETEMLLIAYNKKRIGEEDIIKAHKRSKEFNMSYRIICLGEPLKKVKEFIAAIEMLKGIEGIKDNL